MLTPTHIATTRNKEYIDIQLQSTYIWIIRKIDYTIFLKSYFFTQL